MRAATYVYCLIATPRRPRLSRAAPALPGLGSLRLLDVEDGLFAAVADAPLERYGEAGIKRELCDLDRVSRAAVAHEAVVESFIGQSAVLPMKLFTIFATDERVLEHVRAERPRIAAIVERVADHQEWSIRVVLDRDRAAAEPVKAPPRERSGAAYLARKKAQREAPADRATPAAHEAAGALYERLASRARLARRRLAGDLPALGARLLLEAAFLVPRAHAASFQAEAAHESRLLTRSGCRLTLSGPWPPYAFMQD